MSLFMGDFGANASQLLTLCDTLLKWHALQEMKNYREINIS